LDFYRPRRKWKAYLCQGDVLAGVAVLTVREPLLLISGPEGEEVRGGISVDLSYAAEVADAFSQPEWVAATAVASPVMVLSQTCDVQREDRAFIVVAPLLSMSEVGDGSLAAAIRNGQVYHRLHVPSVPADQNSAGLPDSFVDLTLICSLPRSLVRAEQRIASLSHTGYKILVGALNCYFTRPLREDEG